MDKAMELEFWEEMAAAAWSLKMFLSFYEIQDRIDELVLTPEYVDSVLGNLDY